MNTLTINKSASASDVQFRDQKMILALVDGRELSVPLEWFPRLRNATLADLENYRFIGDGEGIHWETLDEDILVANLLSV